MGRDPATGWTSIQNMPGIFAGGDCATGPATVIRAIAAGKVAAANIDQYLATTIRLPAMWRSRSRISPTVLRVDAST